MMEEPKFSNSGDAIKDFQDFVESRRKFILYCIEKRMTFKEVGEILGISKQRVYQIKRYGIHHRISNVTRWEVKERDNNRCKICGDFNRILDIHHLKNPKNHKKENLILVCKKCHMELEKIKKIGFKKKKVGKNIEIKNKNYGTRKNKRVLTRRTSRRLLLLSIRRCLL